jgi:hypothetical protein
MTEVLHNAIEIRRRQRFLCGLNRDFAALRKNEAAWGEELAERRVWDATLGDGLEDRRRHRGTSDSHSRG